MWSSLVAGSMLAWPGRLSRGGPQNRVVRWAFDSVDWSDSGLSKSPRAMLPSSLAVQLIPRTSTLWAMEWARSWRACLDVGRAGFPSGGAGPPAARWEEGLERVAWCWGQAWSRAS